jgi:hypothetical protein
MGIDGIGKPGAGSPTGGIAGPGSSKPAGTGESFQVGGPTALASASGSDALGRLKSGELTADEYLEQRVGDAVSHLSQKLSAEQIEFVKDTLREQLKTDPVLVELVRRTTA